jgi:potassium channel subfamily K
MPAVPKVTPLDDTGTPQGKPAKQGCFEYLQSKIKSFDYADKLLDPYVKVISVPSLESKKTDDLKDVEEKATWNETLDFKYEGSKQGQLFIEVWDWDIGEDDLIGTSTVTLLDCFKDPGNFVFFKLDLSDADLNDCGELHVKVKLVPDDASSVQKDKDTIAEISKLQDEKTEAQKDAEGGQRATTLANQIKKIEESLGLYPGKLVVEVVEGYRLKNYEKEIASVEDDKRLHFVALFLIGLYLVISIPAYQAFEEGWTAIDCVYFSVCTLTTVGYGDLYPETQDGKLFTCFYVYFGIGIISACAGYLISVMLEGKTSGVAEMMASQSDATELRRKKRHEMRLRLLKSSSMVLAMTLLGAVVYSAKGIGWDIYGSKPHQTGGQAFLDAFYMSCITMTSVGYGDFSPQTQDGRLFAIFWIFIGAVLVAAAGGDLMDSFLESKQDEINRRIIARNLKTKDLHSIDDDDSGEIDELEFISHMLVKLCKCEAEEIQELRDRFAELDSSGDGMLSPQDFAMAAAGMGAAGI